DSVWQFNPGIVTRLVAENEPVRLVFPNYDNGSSRIVISMRRTWGKVALISRRSVITHFVRSHSLRRLAPQLGHRDRLGLFEYRIRSPGFKTLSAVFYATASVSFSAHAGRHR